MPALNHRLPILATILEPVQKLINVILPDFLGQQLERPEVRETIVLTLDEALVRQYPIARLIPEKARRAFLRSQLDLVLDGLLLNDEVPTAAAAGPSVAGFIITVDRDTPPVDAVTEAAAIVLGPGWRISPLPLNERTFLVSHDEVILSVPEAWDATYAFREQPTIESAEPDFLLPAPEALEAEGLEAAADAVAAGAQADGSGDCEWSIKKVNMREAWALNPPTGGSTHGESILIGHPDTGYTRHAENWHADPAQNRLLHQFGYDFWKNDADASDDMDDPIGTIPQAGMFGLPGHGTGTSSVIFSSDGPYGVDHVTGTAPRARLIPFRVAPTVVVWDQRRLADAIIRSTDRGCHVISMSMGGPPSGYLHKAVQRAVANGVIVCSAAGNYVGAWNILPIVAWPAAYEEVLAVAASNVLDKHWRHSSRGKAVDISAPGENVWHATAKKTNDGAVEWGVGPGSGTSFAVATVAGIAACWLAFHGRDKLVALYGLSQLAAVFRQVVTTHGFRCPDGWDTKRFGPGIIDAQAVLRAPLPPSEAGVVSMDLSEQSALDQIANLFDDIARPDLREALRDLVTPATTTAAESDRLEELGDELAFHFYNDPVLREKVRQRLTGQAQADAVAASADPAAEPETLLGAHGSSRLAAAVRY